MVPQWALCVLSWAGCINQWMADRTHLRIALADACHMPHLPPKRHIGKLAGEPCSHVWIARSKLQSPLSVLICCMSWQLPAGGMLLLVSLRHQQACCPFTCRMCDCKSPAGLKVPRVASWNESDHHLAKKVGGERAGRRLFVVGTVGTNHQRCWT